MSNLDRIKLLRQFADEEPDNPFNWYALALEFQDSEPEQTEVLFDKLLSTHKSYLPTYYAAAHFFAERGNLDRSKQIFTEGIELAKDQKNEKIGRELQNSYQNFLFENDLDS